jgi:hypothetical protein
MQTQLPSTFHPKKAKTAKEKQNQQLQRCFPKERKFLPENSKTPFSSKRTQPP